MLLSIPNWAELLSAVICTISVIHRPSPINRWFVLFLWITVVIELLGKLTTSMPAVKIPMYNFFNGAEFVFYMLFFKQTAEKKISKQILWLGINSFLSFFLINLLFFQGLYVYNNHTHTIGSILIIITCVVLFYDISSSETEHYYSFKWSFLYIISGILIFYSGNIFNTSLLNYVAKQDVEKAIKFYKLINHSLNIFLYSSFTVSFVLQIIRNEREKN